MCIELLESGRGAIGRQCTDTLFVNEVIHKIFIHKRSPYKLIVIGYTLDIVNGQTYNICVVIICL